MIRLFTIYTAGPLMSIATIYRDSLLFSLQPRIRRILLECFTLIVVCITITVYITVTVGVRANSSRDIHAWQSANLFPTWLAPILAMIPIASIVMSLWSLKVAFSVSTDVDSHVISLPPMGAVGRDESSGALAPSTQRRAGSVLSSASCCSGQGSVASQVTDEPISYVKPSSLGTTFKILVGILDNALGTVLVHVPARRCPIPPISYSQYGRDGHADCACNCNGIEL
ncbi:hypothetical protein BCR44DRAFT_369743 [Catenaria anguillulae PL171]|uniref:Uncharacterized protein n=1 Tax=Catenaria anguillulae PL171 TaxID=765915 RepID=A0A1Y2H9Q9_9FUNG|nr:hypothetical protein BCR44DRAFT_369743 [Catenaria anguillulae PL171]